MSTKTGSKAAGGAAKTSARKAAARKDAAASAPGAPPALPPVKGGVTAYLMVDGASKAAAFYAKAFGAEEQFRYPEDDKGRTMHIHLYVNGSSLMLSDAYPEHGVPLLPPQAFSLMLRVQDIDAWWKRAVDAGCEIRTPLQLMFWGERYGEVKDPFGVSWSMAQPAA